MKIVEIFALLLTCSAVVATETQPLLRGLAANEFNCGPFDADKKIRAGLTFCELVEESINSGLASPSFVPKLVFIDKTCCGDSRTFSPEGDCCRCQRQHVDTEEPLVDAVQITKLNANGQCVKFNNDNGQFLTGEEWAKLN